MPRWHSLFKEPIDCLEPKDRTNLKFEKLIGKNEFENYLFQNIFKDINSMTEYNRVIKPRHVALKIIDKDDEQIPLSVKSVEELEIANFLYLKGIEFVYEDVYQGKLPPEWERWDTDNSRGYRPDFHLIKKKRSQTSLLKKQIKDWLGFCPLPTSPIYMS